MDSIRIRIEDQNDVGVTRSIQMELAAPASPDRLTQGVEEFVACHLVLGGLPSVERLALHRHHGLETGIAHVSNGVRCRIPLDDEQLRFYADRIELAIL